MKKQNLKSLNLNKKSISSLENNVYGGALPTAKECATGCVGPIRMTCGIINCEDTYKCEADK